MFYGVAVIGDCDKPATARQDPIAARKALMKATGDQAKIGAAMAKDELLGLLARASAHKPQAHHQPYNCKVMFPARTADILKVTPWSSVSSMTRPDA